MTTKPRKMQPIVLVMALLFTGTSVHAEGMTYGLAFKESCRIARAQDFRDAEKRVQDCFQTRNQDRCANLKSTLEQRLFDQCAKADQRKRDSDARAQLRAAQPKPRR